MIKDLALFLLWRGFNPWPRIICLPGVWSKKKKKRKEKVLVEAVFSKCSIFSPTPKNASCISKGPVSSCCISHPNTWSQTVIARESQGLDLSLLHSTAWNLKILRILGSHSLLCHVATDWAFHIEVIQPLMPTDFQPLFAAGFQSLLRAVYCGHVHHSDKQQQCVCSVNSHKWDLKSASFIWIQGQQAEGSLGCWADSIRTPLVRSCRSPFHLYWCSSFTILASCSYLFSLSSNLSEWNRFYKVKQVGLNFLMGIYLGSNL